MIEIEKSTWRAMRVIMLIAGVSIAVACVSLWQLNKSNHARDHALTQAEEAIGQNKDLISQLQRQAAAGAAADADQRRREAAFLLLVQALQDQVRRLGGTPLPVPAILLASPRARESTGSSSPTPQPSAGPTPAPTRTPAPTARPSPSSSPSPTSSPAFCVKVPKIVFGC